MEEFVSQVLDPVCGMTIESSTAARSAEYQGQTYYFCAPGCKKAFEDNPEQYLNQQNQESTGSTEHSCSCGHCH
ncbi:YHS domain-containing protein [Ktedonosporobacter rubrisoli]|uniref:YHS domain-containing protein n=1 Tax=Ktedonosporobacter rubrisoli TaxID=2509675 RepID=A0A4V0YY32_KTERU|nr:YHS domain-containing protein [Ktedonosporobacter rubrisoli]